MDKSLSKANKILKEYNQAHIIPFLEEGTNKELIEQILKMDFKNLEALYNRTKEVSQIKLSNLKPILAVNPDKLQKEKIKEIEEIGIKVLKENKFAVVTMAGGQGTRLGYAGPKGTYKISINGTEKSLFEIIVEDLIRSNEEYNIIIPWYIMTSNENNEDTVKFLEKNSFFGYPKECIYIFKQEELPLLNLEGKLILNKNKTIKKASNGNGGIFKSMLKDGVISDMEKRGIEWIFIGAIDNILLKNVDIRLIGLTKSTNNLIGTKTVLKESPEEKVGVFCKNNNKIEVIEYTELSKDIAQARNNNGELVFGESHIMCNLFNIDAIKKCAQKELEYHIAKKKSNYLDGNGNFVEAEKPNAYKFEQFIFDSFKFFTDITILRGKREEDFAPIKNKEGKDSPVTAKQLYENYWKTC